MFILVEDESITVILAFDIVFDLLTRSQVPS